MHSIKEVGGRLCKARRALANLVAQLLVARMENTALYQSARSGNSSVAVTEKLQPVAA